MARPWLRLYRKTVNNPKVQKLRPELFKAWVNILCATDDDGTVPDTADLAFALRVTESKAKEWVSALLAARLLAAEGGRVSAHDWSEHNYDEGYKHVKSHRARRAAAGLPQQCWISPKVRAAVFERDGNKCCHCDSTENLTIDHIVSELDGGSNELSNLQTLCRPCNASKRDWPNDIASARNAASKAQVRTDTEEDTEKDSEDTTHRRGTRWPEGQEVSAEWLRDGQQARSRAGLNPIELEFEAREFVAHFTGADCKLPVKKDWHAAWLRWCRMARGKPNGPRLNGGKESPYVRLARKIEAARAEQER